MSFSHTGDGGIETIGPTSVDAAAEAGAGGGDMDVWGLSGQQLIDAVVSTAAATWANGSRFTIPGGFARGGDGGRDQLQPTAVDAVAEAGSGGGTMTIWSASDDVLVQGVVSTAARSFSNESSFIIPGAFRHTGNGGKDDQNPGYSVSGILRDGDQNPIGGDVRLLDPDGAIVVEKAVTDRYLVSRPVPPAVEDGSTESGPGTLDFVFEPSGAGFTKAVDGIAIPADTIDAEYGSVSGVVTDVDGTPVVTDEVIGDSGGETTSAFTDDTGEYQFDGPDAQDVTIRGLADSIEVSLTFAEFVNTTQNFQYAGVDVSLEIPGGIPAEDVRVEVVDTGATTRTDGNGLGRFLVVPIDTTVTVRGWEAVDEALLTGGQGNKSTLTVVAGVGVVGSLIDASDGAAVEAVDVKLIAGETTSRSRSTGTGRYQVGNPNAGEVTVRVSDDDWRYERTETIADVADGSSIVLDETLEPKENIGTTS